MEKYKKEEKWEAMRRGSMAAWMGYVGQADTYNLIQTCLNYDIVSDGNTISRFDF